MFRFSRFVVAGLAVFAALSASGAQAGWLDYGEFRDTVKPDTPPAVYAREGKIVTAPWTEKEKAEVGAQLSTVFQRAPGLFRMAAEMGKFPVYRIKMGSSFGGHGALWLSYFGVPVIAHELTHVADAEYKIARSKAFRDLVEPRMKKLRGVMMAKGYRDFTSGEAGKRTDLIYAEGLPSYYAAWTVQEDLAEYVRAFVVGQKFPVPPEIDAFIRQRLIDARPAQDASVAPFRKGKTARLEKHYETAIALLSRALDIDPNFTEAYLERGQAYYELGRQDDAVKDLTQAMKTMPFFDWRRYVPYHYRGLANAAAKRYAHAVGDLAMAMKLNPGAADIRRDFERIRGLATGKAK